MKRQKQLVLGSIFTKNYSSSFGGSSLAGKRKSARPIAVKKPMHFVIKSGRAKGSLSFLNYRLALDTELKRLSLKWSIKILNRVWLTNHIHIIIKISFRPGLKNFLREFSSAIIRVLEWRTKQKLKNFFENRPFSRILEYGRDLQGCIEYLIQNELENFGLRKFKKGSKMLALKSMNAASS